MAEVIPSLALTTTDQSKTTLPKRSHKKSRFGCTSCKLRKVKCDEAHPICRSCRLRGTTCEYGSTKSKKNRSSETPNSDALSIWNTTQSTSIVNEPLFGPPSVDMIDAKLLWFYTSATYKSLSVPDDIQDPVNTMLQTVVVQHAFEAPFLMDSILELASLHMQSLGQATEPTRALVYRARSFEGYRKAIDAALPQTFGALLANSVMRPILSTQFFRDPNFKDLYLLDWMLLWRGVQPILDITSMSSIPRSGLKPLFARPPLDPEVDVAAIPKQLLLMVSFINCDDEDFTETQTYQDSLRALGSLFQNLRKGIDSVMVLRIVIWGTFAPNRLVDLARTGRPRALIILAHYASFLKLVQSIWWLEGVGDRSLRDICHFLGPEWHKYLSIPLSALLIENTEELSRMILDSENQ